MAKAITKIGLTYNFEGQNRSSFADSLLIQADFQKIGQKFLNGISRFSYLGSVNFTKIFKFYKPLKHLTLDPV